MFSMRKTVIKIIRKLIGDLRTYLFPTNSEWNVDENKILDSFGLNENEKKTLINFGNNNLQTI